MKDEGKSKSQLIKELKELRSRNAALERLNKKREAEQKQLTEVKEKYRTFVDMSPDAVVILQGDKYQFVNKVFTKVFGYTQKEVADGLSFFALVKEEDKKAVRHQYKSRLAGKKVSNTYRIDLLSKRGTVIPCETSARLIHLNGKPADLVLIRDITERQKREEELKRSEARYRTLVEQIPAITYTAALDDQSTTLFISPQTKKILGFSPNEWKEKNDIWLQQISPEDKERVLNEVALSHKTGDPLMSEYRMITQDGRTIWIRDEAQIVRDEAGKPVCLQGVMFDITENKATLEALQDAREELERRVVERTAELSKANELLMQEVQERKRTETSLKKSEQKFRLLVESMNDGLAVQDENGIITYVNDKILQMTGYRKNEVTGHHLNEFLDETNQKMLLDQVVRRKRGERKSYELELTGKDGRKISTIMSPAPILDAEGNFKGSFAVITDITELKVVEKTLRQSEKRFKDIAQSMGDWIWEVNEKGIYTYCSESIEEILHLSAEEVIGKRPFDFMLPEEAKRVKRLFSQLARKKEPIRDLENWNIGRNDEPVCLLTNGVPILDEKGKLKGYRGVDKDITERKRFEEVLEKKGRELEDKNASLQEMNTALKVLLEKREEDKKETEQKVLVNVKQLVFPYLEKLKQTSIDQRQEAYVSILEANLKDVISPFSRKISARYLGLTPMELQVANLVKQGKRTKNIAELLNLSPKTIDDHRKSLRKKLEIKNKKVNLRTHLLSLG